MRNILPFVLLLCILLFAGCNDDNMEEDSNRDQLIVGSWTLSGLAYDGTSTATDPNGNVETTEYSGDATAIDISLIIEEEPQIYTSAGTYTVTVTSMVFGQEVSQELVFNNFLGDGTWERIDDSLVTSDINTGSATETNILELTSNSLILDFSAGNQMMVQDIVVDQVISGAAIFRK